MSRVARSRSPRGKSSSVGAIDLNKSEPPKGAFGASGWPYKKSAFLHPDNNMAHCTFKIKELKPKKMSGASFGWQGAGGNQAVHARGDKTGDVKLTTKPSANALVMKWGASSIDCKEFLKHATGFPLEWELSPCEFSSGSFGWHAHRKIEKKVGNKTVSAMVNFNAPIFQSGDARYQDEKDPELEAIENDALKPYMPDPVPYPKKEWKHDLQKISGIGPWIEKRLNKIGIVSCQQLKHITPELEDKICKAIRFFPGRVARDEWKFQAIRIADGTWDQVKGIIAKDQPSGKITIDGKEYEKKLVSLADETMADGHIEFFEAEALFFLASRHDGVSDSETKTLEYILNDKKYKWDDEASLYMRRKLDVIKS